MTNLASILHVMRMLNGLSLGNVWLGGSVAQKIYYPEIEPGDVDIFVLMPRYIKRSIIIEHLERAGILVKNRKSKSIFKYYKIKGQYYLIRAEDNYHDYDIIFVDSDINALATENTSCNLAKNYFNYLPRVLTADNKDSLSANSNKSFVDEVNYYLNKKVLVPYHKNVGPISTLRFYGNVNTTLEHIGKMIERAKNLGISVDNPIKLQ